MRFRRNAARSPSASAVRCSGVSTRARSPSRASRRRASSAGRDALRRAHVDLVDPPARAEERLRLREVHHREPAARERRDALESRRARRRRASRAASRARPRSGRPTRQPSSAASAGVTATQPGAPERVARARPRGAATARAPRPGAGRRRRSRGSRRRARRAPPPRARAAPPPRRPATASTSARSASSSDARPAEHREVRLAGDRAHRPGERAERAAVQDLDREDGADAERDAGDREQEQRARRRAAPGRRRGRGTRLTTGTPPATPEWSVQTSSARAASSRLCVTYSTALPSSRASPRRRSITALAALLVEVAGRLVGEEEPRAAQERAAERDALHLAAGELLDRVPRARRRGPRARGARARAAAASRSGSPATSAGTSTFSETERCGSRWKNWKTSPT